MSLLLLWFAVIPGLAAPGAAPPCEDQDRIQCSLRPDCRGHYAPSRQQLLPDGSVLSTQDQRFRSCGAIPDEVLTRAREERARCSSTGGTWRRTPLDEPGRCSCSAADDPQARALHGPQRFSEELGCESQRQACLALDGVWEAGVAAPWEHQRGVDESACLSRPDSEKRWDSEGGACMTRRFSEAKCRVDGQARNPFHLPAP